jgi:hypothetical protein
LTHDARQGRVDDAHFSPADAAPREYDVKKNVEP